MSDRDFSGEFKVLGVWTVSLLHPGAAPPFPFGLLKSELIKSGAALDAEHRGGDRSPDETIALDPEDRAVAFWTAGTDKLVLREDGLMLWSDLGEVAAETLHQTAKRLADHDEVQTFSLVPMPPNYEAGDVVKMKMKEILEPVNQGPFANGRTWTVVDHIHDGIDTRMRYYEKIGIEIEVPEDRKKKKKKA